MYYVMYRESPKHGYSCLGSYKNLETAKVECDKMAKHYAKTGGEAFVRSWHPSKESDIDYVGQK